MSDELRFNPPSGMNSLSIALLSGHSLCVHRFHPADGKAGTAVPVRFRKEAITQGCAPVGVEIDEDEDQGETRSELILKALEAVIERNDADEIEATGRPKLAAVKKQAGFGLTKAEMDAAFDAFEKSLA
ncbi:hypothetical protein LCG56_26925 [Pseudomonas cannabina pv. alisalensis]|uniref:Uncharacterized protein n=1 Tax=Pseudomonas syringae pv. maculicola str. ES4326 TaxID=629265 RepID=A0A8T8BZZ2_PSEYM|nr:MULTISPECIES: hypothetical protein [Pseudomonas syringae group]QHE96861.1 hypothetical protein PMA4326_009645 [Pseudomonas syringae pv. maculicola str. ES4326]UBY97520.1 hypothetical protein LCG56_26925 [Pseudomonas cannabina pv. alisalensis]